LLWMWQYSYLQLESEIAGRITHNHLF
jgi:hypothetical protein